MLSCLFVRVVQSESICLVNIERPAIRVARVALLIERNCLSIVLID